MAATMQTAFSDANAIPPLAGWMRLTVGMIGMMGTPWSIFCLWLK